MRAAVHELRAPIDRKDPLEQIVDAYRFVESHRQSGNVVIEVLIDVGPPPSPPCDVARRFTVQ